MRIIFAISILIIISGFSTSEAGQIAGPPMPLKLPDDVSWVQTILTTNKDGSRDYQRHAFIAKGGKWRLEYELLSQSTTIIVYDGKSLGTNGNLHKATNPKHKTPEFWDQRRFIKIGYSFLNKSDYRGIDQIDKKKCWHFLKDDNNRRFILWVDVNKMIPRKMFLKNSDGSASRRIFDDIPKHIKITPGLFNVNNLDVILLAK
jgi:outer membrane lipoprotein-sorting protein